VAKVSEDKVLEIIAEIGVNFRTFGGGVNKSNGNPLSEMLKDKPLQFAGAVNVEEVVRFVIAQLP